MIDTCYGRPPEIGFIFHISLETIFVSCNVFVLAGCIAYFKVDAVYVSDREYNVSIVFLCSGIL